MQSSSAYEKVVSYVLHWINATGRAYATYQLTSNEHDFDLWYDYYREEFRVLEECILGNFRKGYYKSDLKVSRFREKDGCFTARIEGMYRI